MMKMFNTLRLHVMTAVLVVGAFGIGGCASMNKQQEGAVIGAATGAAVGGVVGNQTGSTSRGAIIGAFVGCAAGAIIGHQMDQQAKELSQSIPGATVARVGEGIEVTFASGLLFAFDSDQILPAAGTNLTELAKSLNKYPASQGVARTRLAASGKGESEPVATNDTDAGRQKNRRVEVAIYASEAYRQRLLNSNAGD